MASLVWKRTLTAGLFLGLGSTLSPAEVRPDEPVVLPGEIYQDGISEKARADLARPRRADLDVPITLEMSLEPSDLPAQEEPAETRSLGAPRRVGVHRELPAEFKVPIIAKNLAWEPVDGGGEIATFSITSPGARAVRLAIGFDVLPKGAEVRFYSPQNPSDAVGPFEAAFLLPDPEKKEASTSDPFWSPVIQGEAIALEIFVPNWGPGDDVSLSLMRLSHIYRSLDPINPKGPGDSGSCNRDIVCSAKWLTAGDAVARYFVERSGSTLTCTGQLVVDGDLETQRFLFVTAAHCFETRAEAKTLDLEWFYQRALCDSGGSTTTVRTGGGAKLRFSTAQGGIVDGDITLVELNRKPPNGVAFQGWTVAGGHVGSKKGASLHHPSGDYKMIALLKKITAEFQVDSEGTLLNTPPFTHYEVVWKKKTTTESGSSGASLMIGKRWPKQFVIGVLTGGFAGCDNLAGQDYYGSLKHVFDNNRKFRKALSAN